MPISASAYRCSCVLTLVALLLTGPSIVVGQDPRNPLADDANLAPSRLEHLRQLGVANWHAKGLRGKGLKVAVLDSGFHQYKTQLGKSLPDKVITRSFRTDGNLEAKESQHGILCAEIVHTLAPDAEILLANWEPCQPASFLEAVRWAIESGARIISCSIIMPTWSDGEGGGPIHTELRKLVGDGSKRGDVLFFASAGNTADRHWCGIFTETGRGWHDWGKGIDNHLLPWSENTVSVEMCTSQDADLELVVENLASERVEGRCRLFQGEHRTAVVRFVPKPTGRYAVRIRAVGKATSERFHLYVLGANLRQSLSAGSISFPGDGPEVVTLGAVEADERRAGYSSCGPNSAQLKPDLTALVPFVSAFRERPFSGTSAAAPQAAGLAAILWAKRPQGTACEIRDFLVKASRDLGPRGHDWETGHGLLRLPNP